MNFQLWPVLFLIPLELQGQTVPHWKALRYGKDESRGLSYDRTLSICQDVLKSGNLLHKRGLDYSQSHTTVNNALKKGQKCKLFCLTVRHMKTLSQPEDQDQNTIWKDTWDLKK